MKKNSNAKNIYYFGPFYTARITKERGLPTRNIAAYNRMIRFAHALEETGKKVRIISGGISMRSKWKKRFIHPLLKEKIEGIDVYTCSIPGIPYFAYFMEPLFILLWGIKNLRKKQIEHVLIYNFTPAYVVLALLLRGLGIPFFSQIEDVSIPELRDWSKKTETNPRQQLIYNFCMRTITFFSQGIIAPSQRIARCFKESLPKLVITGCIDNTDSIDQKVDLTERPLKLLFVGKYLNEHGLDVLIETIKCLKNNPEIGSQVEINCCGIRKYPQALQKLSEDKNDPQLILHGFLDDDEYQKLLSQVHIALTLQKSKGRNSQYKTPSKAYEFQARGKLVLAYDIGDLALLAGREICIIKEETAEALILTLEDCLKNPNQYDRIVKQGIKHAEKEYAYKVVGKRMIDFMENRNQTSN